MVNLVSKQYLRLILFDVSFILTPLRGVLAGSRSFGSLGSENFE
jgi:hypothetical protein